MKKIVFVCTGNTCRSPMAEGFFKELLKQKGRTDVLVSSAGISTVDGHPAAEHSITAMNEVGIDIHAHRSTRLTQDMLKADWIITMTEEQQKILAPYSSQVFSMPVPVADPYGGNLEEYRLCRDQIAAAMPQIFESLVEPS